MSLADDYVANPDLHASPLYDRMASLARLRGDESLLRDVAGFFHEDAPKLVAQVCQALEHHDLPAAARAAHTICGLASAFDARQAVQAAELVETLAKSGREEGLAEAAEQLATHVKALDAALDQERR